EFVAYLLRPDVSITIMDYIGYPSVVSGDEVYDYAIETAFDFDVERDASYFFEGKEPAVISHMKYPDISQVSSAAVMRDFGDANSRINDMWATVKGNTLTPIIIIVDSLVGIALIFMLYKKIKSLIKKYK
ncbi:MAG: hypothetical protein IJ938_05120, partial [Clostridia bacterium]|nr:hypothetical protein [Clostridia bacterium]